VLAEQGRASASFHPQPKPEKMDRVKGRKDRAVAKHVHRIHEQVFDRDNSTCRVCGNRGESMHELIFTSLIGDRIQATTLENCLTCCGSGTTGCHGLLQRNILIPLRWDANRPLVFIFHETYAEYAEIKALRARYVQGRGDTVRRMTLREVNETESGEIACAYGTPWLNHFDPPLGNGHGCPACEGEE
jgi:hypothetical protein